MNESRVSRSVRRLGAAACLLALLLPLPARSQATAPEAGQGQTQTPARPQTPAQPPTQAQPQAPPLPQPEGRPKYQIKAEVESPAPADIPVVNGAVELSLDRAIEIAIRRNLGIVVERYNRVRARLGIYQALGIYDLNLTGLLDTQAAKAAVTNTTRPTNSRQQDAQLGLAQNLPTGGNLSLGFGATRAFQEFLTPNLNTIGTTFYTSGLTFSYIQPLLRNFGRDSFEHTLLIAENSSGVAESTFVNQLTSILQQVENAYWQLVNARGQLVVAQDSLGLAKELDARNQIQVKVGTLAPLELVQSGATIATREEGIISAQEQVADAADQLRRLLNFPPGELWAAEIKPITEATVATRPPIDLDASITEALKNRPELKSQQLAVELARLNASFARNQARPQLNLTVSYGAGGAGTNFSESFSQATGFGFPNWKAELDLAVPLQNRAARGAIAESDLDAARTKVELDQLKTVVVTDVRQAARRVETASKQIDAAVAARKAQETNLDAERKRYENGMSTSFEITRIQDDLTAARSSEITAVVGYRTALADYYRAIGTLLGEEGVAIEDRDPAVHRFTFTPGKQEQSYERP
jgi:outer membrane protein